MIYKDKVLPKIFKKSSSIDFVIEKSNFFRKMYFLYFVVIIHPQSLKVSLRNSFYIAR